MKNIIFAMITVFLIILPFMGMLQQALDLPRQYLWADEIFVVFSLGLILPAIVERKDNKKPIVGIIVSFLILAVVGVTSSLYNANSFMASSNGIFDYIKNFLVIPVFCLFSFKAEKVRGLYRTLNRLALIFCFTAILQEAAYLFDLPVEKFGVHFVDVRFGLLRAPSLMGHPNIFGLYALLFFVLNFSIHRRLSWQSAILALGALLSVSRMVWTAFFFVLALFSIDKQSRRAIGLFTLVMIVIILAVPAFYLYTREEIGSPGYFREYVMVKSLRIWRDHPVLGIGPGMYGGVASFMFGSPVYGKYFFNERWMDVIENIFSVDQFWPQVLVEMGVLGTLSFAFILFALWRAARTEIIAAGSLFRRNILFGFSFVPLVLSIYLLGSGLNLTPFLLTYSVLFGMTLGAEDENITDQ